MNLFIASGNSYGFQSCHRRTPPLRPEDKLSSPQNKIKNRALGSKVLPDSILPLKCRSSPQIITHTANGMAPPMRFQGNHQYLLIPRIGPSEDRYDHANPMITNHVHYWLVCSIMNICWGRLSKTRDHLYHNDNDKEL